MEHKDKKSLKTVEDSEDVRHDDRILIEVQQSKSPSQSEQEHKDDCPTKPCPAATK